MLNWDILGQQLINGLVLGAIYGLIAIGYSMVYGIIGLINFAHGDVYMVSAYLTAICLALLSLAGITSIPLMLMLTFIITICFIAFLGFAIEKIAYRPLQHAPRLAPLISAIGVSLILQNFVRITQSARSQSIPALLEGGWHLGRSQGIQISLVQCLIIIITLISTLMLSLIIAKTAIGRAMRATQQDLNMAAILGINPNQIIPLVFVMGAIMAAIAGVLVSLNYGSFNFFIGFIIGIKAFTCAVIGGIGSLPGALLGGFILGMAETLFAGFINVDYKDVFAFAILIFVLVFKPQGLLGTPDVEKV